MLVLQALLLGIVQGLTEFIPVSSSGHLILAERWLGFEAGLAFDVALHIGTLAALVIMLRKEIGQIVRDMLHGGPQRQLGWLIILATLPAVVIGGLAGGAIEANLRSHYIVAFNLVLVAGVMLVAERQLSHPQQLASLRPGQALLVGVAQATALVPGVSRSGATIVAGLFAGLDRVAAARFSFLMSIPVITGAIVKSLLLDDASLSSAPGGGLVLVAGIVASLLSGMVAIRFLLDYLSRSGLKPFAYYRIVLGLAVLGVGVLGG